MSEFNWNTEEDENVWSDDRSVQNLAGRGSRRWMVIFIIIGLLSGSGWLLYRQVQNRLETAETQTENDVIASHELVWQSQLNNDTELFSNLLSGRDPQWADSLFLLHRENLLYERPFLEITLPDDFEIAASRPSSITLSPDLTVAEFTYQIPYQDPLYNTIHYEFDAVYRLGQDRWLLAPAFDDSWRQTGNIETTFVTATYPLPDEELVHQLVNDINIALTTICSSYFDGRCVEGNLWFRLTFTSDPSSILQMNLESPGTRVATVPTPSLLGRPTDEFSYHRLYQGYARHIAADMLDDALWQAWSDDEDIYRVAARLMTEQLLQASYLSEPAALETNHSVPADVDQQIALLCLQDGQTRLNVFHPNQLTFGSSYAETGQRLTELIPNSADDLLVIRQSSAAASGSASDFALLLWEPHTEKSQVFTGWNAAADPTVEWRTHPEDERLLIQYPPRNGENSGQVDIFQFSQCQSGSECRIGQITQADAPYWSPNGQHTLFSATGAHIFLGDASGTPIRHIDEGIRPYWVNDSVFRFLQRTWNADGYLQQADLMEGSLLTTTQSVAVSEQTFLNSITADLRPKDILMGYAFQLGQPHDDTTLLLGFEQIQGDLGNRDYLFLYNGNLNTISNPFVTENMYAFGTSHSDRFVLIVDDVPEQPRIVVIDRESNRRRTYQIESVNNTISDWSVEEQWLLLLEEGALRLINVEEGKQYSYMPGDLGSCYDAAWINGN